MNKLIKKLKDKNYVRAFGLMSPEEQECFRKANNDNAVIMYVSTEGNKAEWHSGKCKFDCPDYTYAIKPDYQPEPEYRDWVIIYHSVSGFLGCSMSRGWMNLHELPSLPNFEGFYMPDPVVKDGHEYLFIGTVARNIAKGKTVYARFRK